MKTHRFEDCVDFEPEDKVVDDDLITCLSCRDYLGLPPLKPDGYHDCDCCGETIVGEFLCEACVKAGCEAHVCADKHWNGRTCDMDGVYDNCQIPRCDNCDTQASFFANQSEKGDIWQSNCDPDECEEEAQSKDEHGKHVQREWKA